MGASDAVPDLAAELVEKASGAKETNLGEQWKRCPTNGQFSTFPSFERVLDAIQRRVDSVEQIRENDFNQFGAEPLTRCQEPFA